MKRQEREGIVEPFRRKEKGERRKEKGETQITCK